MSKLELTVRDGFSAVLALADHDGVCRNLHGYRFQIAVTVRATVDPVDPWIMDFAELDATIKKRIIEPLDGADLRTHMAYPSMEGLLLWIVTELSSALPLLWSVELEAPPRFRVFWRTSVAEDS